MTGGDGFLVADPLQYLTWLREAGDHGAVANLYDLEDGPRSFVHPGRRHLGPAPPAGLGAGGRVHGLEAARRASRSSQGRWRSSGASWRGATTVGWRSCSRCSSLSPVAALVGWSGIGGNETKFDFDFVAGELWPGTYLWGYLFTALAVGLLPLGAARLRARPRRRLGGRTRCPRLRAAC